jgi:hypothetical protein
MADPTLWTEKGARAAFEARARTVLESLKPQLHDQNGVIAIEPESGDHFIGATLGKANAAAYAKYPDRWVYFARLDALDAAIALPTW